MTGRCPECGNTRFGPGDVFCPECGEALFSGPEVTEGGGFTAQPTTAPPVAPPVFNAGSGWSDGRYSSEGLAGSPRQVGATPQISAKRAAYTRKSLAGKAVKVTLACFLVGLVFTALFLISATFRESSMRLGKPSGWREEGDDAKEFAEENMNKGGRVKVDFYYVNPESQQLMIGFHHAPFVSEDPLYGLPDTRDVVEMDAYLEERTATINEFSSTHGWPGVSLDALPMGCGNVALEISGTIIKDAKSAEQVQLFIRKGDAQFCVLIVSLKGEDVKATVDYVAGNLEF